VSNNSLLVVASGHICIWNYNFDRSIVVIPLVLESFTSSRMTQEQEIVELILAETTEQIDALEAIIEAAQGANATMTNATSFIEPTAAVASIVSLIPRAPTCPNLSPFEHSFICANGGEALFAQAFNVPLWFVLSHSAQGILALFSVKHLALQAMPMLRRFFGKLDTLRTGGRLVRDRTTKEGRDGLEAAFTQAETERPKSVLPALLESASDLPDSALEQADESMPDAAKTTLADEHEMALPALPPSFSASSSSSSAAPPSLALSRSTSSSSSSRSSAAAASRHALLHQLYVSSSSDRLASMGRNTLELILSFLSARELSAQMSISKTWYRSANSNHLWHALHKLELVREFMKKENGLNDVMEGLGLHFDDASSSSSSSDSPTAPVLTPTIQKPRRRDWELELRQHVTQLVRAVIRISQTWLHDLVEGNKPSSRPGVEAEYLAATHRLTEAIQKINEYLSYIKQAEKHALEVWEMSVGGSSSSSSNETVKPKSWLKVNHGPTSTLLLTSCALVQAIHRFCSGTTQPTVRPLSLRSMKSGSASSSSSVSASASSSSASELPSSLPSSLEEFADTSSSSSSSLHPSIATDAAVLSQVLQEQQFGVVRRRRNGTSAVEEENDSELPVQRPAMQSASSYGVGSSSSVSSSPSSIAPTPTPSLQRSHSTPTPQEIACGSKGHKHSSSCIQRFLPPRQWHSIQDVLLMMSHSKLIHFPFDLEDAIRLHSPEAKLKAKMEALQAMHQFEDEQKRAVEGKETDTEERKLGGLDDSASSSSIAIAPVAAAAPDEPDDSDDGFSSSSDEDSDESDSSSGESDLGSSGDESDDESDQEEAAAAQIAAGLSHQMLQPHDAPHPALPNPSAIAPAANAAASKVTKMIFIADIDEVGNLFMTQRELTDHPKPKKVSDASSSTASSAAASSSDPLIPAGDSSISSSSDATLTDAVLRAVAKSQNDAATSSSSLSKATPSGETRQRRASSTSGDGKATNNGVASSKAKYIEAYKFLKLQNSVDDRRREESKLVTNQLHTARIHETLRQGFKGLILASMLWSQQGAIHLIIRYGSWFLLVWCILKLCGIEFEFDDGPPANGGGAAGGELNDLLQQLQFNHPDDHAPHLWGVILADFLLPLGLLPPPVIPPHQEMLPGGEVNAVLVPPEPIDPEVMQRIRWKRLLVAIALVVAVEGYLYYSGASDPVWAWTALSAFLRLLPLLSTMSLLVCLLAGVVEWRERMTLITVASIIVLESLFTYFEFHAPMRNSFLSLVSSTLLPRLWNWALLAIRIAPLACSVISFGLLFWTIADVCFPLVVQVPFPPLQWNQNFQWNQIWHVLRHEQNVRNAYAVTLFATMAAITLETIFAYWDWNLGVFVETGAVLKRITPVLLSLAYDCMVFEGRGVILGLACARFIWVVDQSLPIHCLTILKSATSNTRNKRNGKAQQQQQLTAGETNDESSSSSNSSSLQVVCLSCQRAHAHPLRPIRWLIDLIFETHLLVTAPLSGVQGVMIQKKEQEMREQLGLGDVEQTQQHDETGEADESSEQKPRSKSSSSLGSAVHIQTCVDCTVHSVRMQLFLPFFYSALLLGAFAIAFPAPRQSTYRDLLTSALHYLLDRVPLLCIIDIAMGFYHQRVLKYARAYWTITALVLTYAAWVSSSAWWMQLEHAYLLPGFLYMYRTNAMASSILALDVAWIVLWTLN
jgi:hypothetical protein